VLLLLLLLLLLYGIIVKAVDTINAARTAAVIPRLATTTTSSSSLDPRRIIRILMKQRHPNLNNGIPLGYRSELGIPILGRIVTGRPSGAGDGNARHFKIDCRIRRRWETIDQVL